MIIETKGLRKSFRSRQGKEKKTVEAVRGVDLQVREGEIFGFLGPNGAGKTTTLRMLATLIEPDGGDATIAGVDLRRDPGEVRRRIGYVAQGGSTWDDSTAREELVLQARLYGLSQAATRRSARRVPWPRSSSPTTPTASARPTPAVSAGGSTSRSASSTSRSVVFLDEPTTGLDPQSRAHMWDEIRRLRTDGMTVFITTHYLDEADALCDRIAIMDDGLIVAEGTPDGAQARDLRRRRHGRSRRGERAARGRAARGAGVRRPGSKSSTRATACGSMSTTGRPRCRPCSARSRRPASRCSSMELHRPSLDDVFLTKTGRSLREK